MVAASNTFGVSYWTWNTEVKHLPLSKSGCPNYITGVTTINILHDGMVRQVTFCRIFCPIKFLICPVHSWPLNWAECHPPSLFRSTLIPLMGSPRGLLGPRISGGLTLSLVQYWILSACTAPTYIFTARTCTTSIITLKPCALNAEFHHFILRFNKISILCGYHWKRG
jgi:hypothetical protein